MQLGVLAAGQTAYRSRYGIWVHSLVGSYANVKPPIHPAAYVSTLQNDKAQGCPGQKMQVNSCN